MCFSFRTEGFDNEELIRQFRQITGESAADCLKMVEKVINQKNLVCLLHGAIIYANEVRPTCRAADRNDGRQFSY